MRQSFDHSNDKLLSHYSFMRSNISIKYKSLKKRSGYEDYFNKFDLLNHFKRLFVEMCSFWLIRKVCRERKIIRALTTHLHNMLFTVNN